MAVATELVGGHMKRFFLGHGEPRGTANAIRASPEQAFLREPSWTLWLMLSLAPNTTERSKVDAGLVIEGYAPTRRVLLKNPPQFAQHGFVFRMPWPRRVRRRQQPPFKPRVVELLPHGIHTLDVWRRIEKFIHR